MIDTETDSKDPLFIDNKDRVSLKIRDLYATLNQQSHHRKGIWFRKRDEELGQVDDCKVILNKLNLDIEPGNVLAILGSSGSGKTTLLNTLAGRIKMTDKSPFKFKGLIRFTPEVPNISYLLQEDVFTVGLTTFEILYYTAMLKLPNASKVEKLELIDYLLKALNLLNVKDTIICNFKRQITSSGGECRRVSLALQLLTKPSILFLDEPTTGLDSTSSINLISTIKQLSHDFGITIILTIHQPRIEIIKAVDSICLMSKGGSMIYCGSLEEGSNYFKFIEETEFNGVGLSSKSKEESNFADFLLTISSVDKYTTIDIEKETETRVVKLVTLWRKYHKFDKTVEFQDTFENASPSFKLSHLTSHSSREKLPFYKESYVIFKRSNILTLRDYQSFLMLFGINTLLAVVCGYAFYKPDGSLAGIRSVTSVLYVCCEIIGFTPLVYEIERLASQDGKSMLKEYKDDHLYSLHSWFIGRKLSKFLLEDLPISLAWSLVTFYMWGLQNDSNFGVYFVANLLIYMVGISMAHLCYVVGDYDFPLASLVSEVLYQVQNSACGYFVNAKTMPVYVRWTKYVATFWYSFGCLVSNNFTNYYGDCVGEECSEFDGAYILDNLGYPKKWVLVPIMVNVCWFLGYYILSWFLIWFKCQLGTVKIAKEKKSKSDNFRPGKLLDTVNSIDSIKSIKIFGKENGDEFRCTSTVPIGLSNITLALKRNFVQNKILKKPFSERKLLNNINLEFKPGLNAIMGPSGSGKTTLLNLMTGRTRSSNFSIHGDVSLDRSTSIPFTKLSKLTSYVHQEDSSLIPTLTVRETLYYQAKLRVSSSKHHEIDIIIHELMKKVGLLEVMNVPVGDYRIKGISGGEKRRLSVAIQLLDEDNKYLLLDEPTSGLDSFTSTNLITLLQKISKEDDKVIILTIHQPKFEIFQVFDKICLLKDGELVYEGDPKTLINVVGDCHDAEKSNGGDVNFADYLMDVLNDSRYEDKMIQLKNFQIDKHQVGTPFLDNNHVRFNSFCRKRQSFKVALSTIFQREFKVILRTEGVLLSRVGQYIGIAIIHSLYFAPLRKTSDSISNRLGLIQEVLNLYFAGLFNNMSLYPIVRETFYQENKDDLYSSSVFMISYFFNEIPNEIICSFILSCFLVLVIGLPRTGGMFCTMWYMCTLCVNCGESVGIMFNSIFDQVGISINVLSNIMVVGIFMGGTMSLQMPTVFKAFNYISPLKYAVLSMAQLGFEGQTFKCLEGETECYLSTGEDVLKHYGLESTLWVNYVAVLAIAIVYRLLAYVSLRLKLKRR